MHFTIPEPDMLSVCLFGVEASLLGLLGLLFGRSLLGPQTQKTLAGLVVGAVCASEIAAWTGQEKSVWLPPLALSTLVLFLSLLRHPLVGRAFQFLLGLLRNGQIQWVGLLLLGPVVALWQAEEFHRWQHANEGAIVQTDNKDKESDLKPLEGSLAVTDRGEPVPLYTFPSELHSRAESEVEEAKFLESMRLITHVIRTGEAYPVTSNCHGWVFAGGQYWVRGEQVPLILRSNGYHRVSVPTMGDVAVFRNVQGAVVHTGLVRGIDEENLILIESKWGRYGRFIHTADQHPYSNYSLSWYHTSRGGHLLRGLPATNHDGHDTHEALASQTLAKEPLHEIPVASEDDDDDLGAH